MRFAAWIGLVILIIGGSLLLVRPSSSIGLTTFIFIWLAAGTAVLAMGVLLATTPTTAIRLSRRVGVAMVLGGAVVLQVRGLFHAPRLSQDMARYRADGRIWADGASPYQLSPLEMQRRATQGGLPYPLYAEYRQVPHAMLRTIYPPVAQAWFRLVEYGQEAGRIRGIPAVARTLGPDPPDTFSSVVQFGRSSHAALYRVGAGAFAVATTAVLLLCLRRLDRSPWYAALFAWNPLTMVECSGQGHIDMIGAFFVVAAVALAMRERFALAGVAVALAAGIKPQAAVLLPFVAAAAWRCSPSLGTTGAGRGEGFASAAPRAAAVLGVGVLSLAVVYFPLLLSPANWHGWRETMDVYAMSWEANGSIYELITAPFRDGDGRTLEDAKMAARVVAGVGAFLAFFLCLRRRLPPADAAYWLTLVPLLLAPVVYPWYLLWGLAVVPLLTRTRGWTLLAWAATSGLSYHLWLEPTWSLGWPWAMAEYVPVYVAIAVEAREMLKDE